MIDLRTKPLLLWATVIITAFLYSCSDTTTGPEEPLPSRVIADQLLENFVQDAQRFGYILSPDNVEIELTDEVTLEGRSIAGRSIREQGIVRIDTTSNIWQAGPERQEQLMYHELGHYFLAANHSFHVLPDDSLGSLMHPGIPFFYDAGDSELREYYITQLFNNTTPIELPETSAPQPIETFQNGDFSDGLSGWQTSIADSTSSPYRVEVDNEIFASAPSSIKVFNESSRAEDDDSIITSQFFQLPNDIPPGSVIELSFDLRVDNISLSETQFGASFIFTFFNVTLPENSFNGPFEFNFRKDILEPTDGFERVTITLPNFQGDLSEEVRIAFGMAFGVSATAYFDNFKLVYKSRI